MEKEPKSNGLAVTLKKVSIQQQQQTFSVLVYLNDENFCQIGDKVKIQGKLKQLQEKRNQGMFHQILYYKTRNITYLCNGSEILLQEKGEGIISKMKEYIYQFRIQCYKRLFDIFPEDTASMAGAILLGIKTDMEEEVKNLYQQAGIFHLISISGLHISCLGLGIYHLLRKLTGSYGVSGMITSVFLGFYCILCGNSVSAQRSVLMAVILMGSWYLGRSYDMLTALSVSAIMILLRAPYQVYQAGFQLSFGAVLGICVVSEEFTKAFGKNNKWMQAVFGNLGIQLTTLPIILYYYFELPLYSLLLNLILVPGMSLLLMSCSLALVGSFVHSLLGQFLSGVAVAGFEFYEKAATFTLNLPFSRISIGQPSFLGIFCYYSVLFAGVYFIHQMNEKKQEILQEEKGAIASYGREDKYNNGMFVVIIISVLFLWVHKNPPLKITMLDVGQGDGLVIQYNHHVYLADGGSTNVNQVGKYRLLPYLKAQGIRKIDGVFISHMDSDHVSGIIELLEYAGRGEIDIVKLYLPNVDLSAEENYKSLQQLIQQQKIPVVYLQRGLYLQDKELKFLVLQPKEGICYDNSNECSMVFQLNYKEFSMLFTGDVEGQGEKELLDGEVLQKVTVLKTPHHGSKYTTSKELLQKIKPQIALISCSKDNGYGHPHAEVLQRLNEVDAGVYITMDFGQVTVETNGKDVVLYKYCNRNN